TRLVHRVEPVRAGRTRNRLPANRHAVARGGRPGVRREIRMRVVNAGVDDPDDGVARSEGEIPRGGGPDVRAGGAGAAIAGLPDIPQPPQFRKSWIVGFTRRINNVIGLEVLDLAARR